MLETWKESQEKASQGAKGRGHIRKEGVGNYEECSQGTKGLGEVGMEDRAPAAVLVMEAGDELLGTMRLETSGGRREACAGGGDGHSKGRWQTQQVSPGDKRTGQ